MGGLQVESTTTSPSRPPVISPLVGVESRASRKMTTAILDDGAPSIRGGPDHQEVTVVVVVVSKSDEGRCGLAGEHVSDDAIDNGRRGDLRLRAALKRNDD